MPTFNLVLIALTLLAALGSGLMAGVFFAFSNFVMKALEQQPVPAGIAAMQAINRTVLNPFFLGVFSGTALISLVTIIVGLFYTDDPGDFWLIAGGVDYLSGVFSITMVFNVPRNNILARVDPEDSWGQAVWQDYRKVWTRWNHVRAAMSLLAMLAFIFAFCRFAII